MEEEAADRVAEGQLELDEEDSEPFEELEPEDKEDKLSDLGRGDEIGSTIPSELSFSGEPALSPALKRKKNDLLNLLAAETLDRARLLQMALSEGGLIDDEIRKKAWPLLLNIGDESTEKPPTQEEIEKHPEYRQVVMDVNRSLKRFPPGIPYEQRVALQDQLTRLILRVIMKYPHLCYYQGYHDVAVTFLLVVGEDKAFYILEKLSTEHLRVCMEPTMDTTSRLLNTIYPLISRKNPQLHEYLERSEAGTLFALPWFLTWFGHSLSKYSAVVRMYDFFLCSAPQMPLYVAATIVLYRTEEVLETPCQMDCMHGLLSQLPENLPFEKILKQAERLYLDFPPESIEKEVDERTKREFELRFNPPPKAKAVVKKKPPTKYLFGLRNILAVRRPTSYVQMFVATASVMFSLYMYMRTGAEQGQLPIAPS
ncbi:TBC1 domain family member 20 [Neocloeon triangulifer]|uniref:TBC1 domain family member 20 n=1 Tax=Neocloeon triangulifer TaxID=2078957 RepID=UPI00286EFC37|nr:TBC1 domain family member 20 [Neocloeon triangulifer]